MADPLAFNGMSMTEIIRNARELRDRDEREVAANLTMRFRLDMLLDFKHREKDELSRAIQKVLDEFSKMGRPTQLSRDAFNVASMCSGGEDTHQVPIQSPDEGKFSQVQIRTLNKFAVHGMLIRLMTEIVIATQGGEPWFHNIHMKMNRRGMIVLIRLLLRCSEIDKVNQVLFGRTVEAPEPQPAQDGRKERAIE